MNIFLSNAPRYLQPRNRHCIIFDNYNENCVICIGYYHQWVPHASTFRIAKKKRGGGEVLNLFGIYILTRLSPQAYDDSKDLTEAINYKSNNIDNIFC